MIFISSFWYIVGSGLESLGELLCLVVGAFGEVSEDLERTIKAIAESRALFLSRETGQPVSEARAGWIFGQYRRLLTRLFISNLTSCLLARMGHFEGGGQGGCIYRRRGWGRRMKPSLPGGDWVAAWAPQPGYRHLALAGNVIITYHVTGKDWEEENLH